MCYVESAEFAADSAFVSEWIPLLDAADTTRRRARPRSRGCTQQTRSRCGTVNSVISVRPRALPIPSSAIGSRWAEQVAAGHRSVVHGHPRRGR